MDCSPPGSSASSCQEYGNGLPFPSPWDLLDPEIEPEPPALASRFFTTEPPGVAYLGTPNEASKGAREGTGSEKIYQS